MTRGPGSGAPACDVTGSSSGVGVGRGVSAVRSARSFLPLTFGSCPADRCSESDPPVKKDLLSSTQYSTVGKQSELKDVPLGCSCLDLVPSGYSVGAVKRRCCWLGFWSTGGEVEWVVDEGCRSLGPWQRAFGGLRWLRDGKSLL